MMSKSLTFYLLNHYQGVIILVCVICIYIYSLYNCTMVINLSHLISQILIFKTLPRAFQAFLHYLGMHTQYSGRLIY